MAVRILPDSVMVSLRESEASLPGSARGGGRPVGRPSKDKGGQDVWKRQGGEPAALYAVGARVCSPGGEEGVHKPMGP